MMKILGYGYMQETMEVDKRYQLYIHHYITVVNVMMHALFAGF